MDSKFEHFCFKSIRIVDGRKSKDLLIGMEKPQAVNQISFVQYTHTYIWDDSALWLNIFDRLWRRSWRVVQYFHKPLKVLKQNISEFIEAVGSFGRYNIK